MDFAEYFNLLNLVCRIKPLTVNTIKTKKILACTNLSKLNSSRKEICGISLPGIPHKIRIINAHSIDHNVYLKNTGPSCPPQRGGKEIFFTAIHPLGIVLIITIYF
jgi:hypothetical protein